MLLDVLYRCKLIQVDTVITQVDEHVTVRSHICLHCNLHDLRFAFKKRLVTHLTLYDLTLQEKNMSHLTQCSMDCLRFAAE